ncbi:MAG: TIGR03643 family protein [Roseibacillus sp.]
MTDAERDRIIRMAWEDRTTFEEIEQRTGFTEAEVIKVMRNSLRARSFRLWRKRVTGRVTKHRKLMKGRGVGVARRNDDFEDDWVTE